MPVQARMKNYSFRASLSFEAPPRSDSSLSPSLRLSVDEGSIEILPNIPSVRDIARHTHISRVSMPAAPQPAFARDRQSRASNQDVGQLA
jgi:hypothetical protein